MFCAMGVIQESTMVESAVILKLYLKNSYQNVYTQMYYNLHLGSFECN